MNRREFLGRLAVSAGAWALPGCAAIKGRSPMHARGNRPNILLVMADDVGIEAFGCYGGSSYETPVIDGLAETGVRFTHCYSQPLCTPSRVKIMTGMSNARNYTYFGILDPGEKTFAHMLREAGYRTAVAGKWQLYGTDKYGELEGTGAHPRDAGFDAYCLWQLDRLGSRYWDPLIERNGTVLTDTKGKYGPDLFCEFIEDFMERNREEPFFIYYPMALVHSPFVPTPDSKNRESKKTKKNFRDMMAYMDRIMGRLVNRLDALGLRENTLVLFTSDNGTHQRITSMMGDRKVQGGKSSMTDEGTRVPLVVSWPGTAPRGRVCEDLVDFSDFLPTLAEAGCANLPPGRVIDGRSFLPQIKGLPGDPREWIFCFYHSRPRRDDCPAGCYARNARWKVYGDGKLFDLASDPGESFPLKQEALSREAAVIRGKLQKVIDEYLLTAKPSSK